MAHWLFSSFQYAKTSVFSLLAIMLLKQNISLLVLQPRTEIYYYLGLIRLILQRPSFDRVEAQQIYRGYKCAEQRWLSLVAIDKLRLTSRP